MKTILIAALCLAACNAPNVGARSSGSLAASKDDALLYAADTDNGVLGVIELSSNTKLAEVKVGVSPWRVTVGSDDTIYVANRGSRSISVIRRGDWKVAAELATDVDPVGMVASPDGKYLYVVCATSATASEYGTLTAFDLATLSVKWTLNLGDEPRGIALVEGNRAIISLYREGEVVEVNLEEGKLATKAPSSIYQAANRSSLTFSPTTGAGGGGGFGAGGGTGGGSTFSNRLTFHPRAASDVIATPDGKRVFVTALLSREAAILTPPSPITPYYKAQGPGLAGSVTTGAVFTIDTGDGQVIPRIDDISGTSTRTNSQESGAPQTSFATRGYGSAVLQGPTVGVVDYSGEWLYVVNRETSTLALISANRRVAVEPEPCGNYYCGTSGALELPSVHSTTSVGSGADGIVVMGDNKTAYVYSQFEHAVTKVVFDGSAKRIASQGTIMTVGKEVLPYELAQGRKLFFDATDRRVSAEEASVACSSCHLEGRDDGHTWNFPDGPRQTPTLAGRGMADTAPYHWSGEFPGMQEFLTHTITSRMGGTGVDQTSTVALNQFMAKMTPPENPYALGELTVSQKRGQQVFSKAQCSSCHSGKWLTNNTTIEVGTLAQRDNGLVRVNGLNVPSLKGLARSGPYLHDGSVITLKERVIHNPGDKHGVTSTLSAGEVDDLVEYLRAL
jgi:YVTN family beta-propeller protein